MYSHNALYNHAQIRDIVTYLDQVTALSNESIKLTTSRGTINTQVNTAKMRPRNRSQGMTIFTGLSVTSGYTVVG